MEAVFMEYYEGKRLVSNLSEFKTTLGAGSVLKKVESNLNSALLFLKICQELLATCNSDGISELIEKIDDATELASIVQEIIKIKIR